MRWAKVIVESRAFRLVACFAVISNAASAGLAIGRGELADLLLHLGGAWFSGYAWADSRARVRRKAGAR